ncbi:hypothetical protein [Microcella humidisoli]|uniref:DUF4760 domain-containing protein n=1 Tax=Microcella humidisoli TaxID=2963406 RepID=A0ABY5FV56_9MICO|nr:hypothetical protein [Microcella humidisoli]UTT62128.1 hypothetical protein NNL39_10740 [Microcella humidisoli]
MDDVLDLAVQWSAVIQAGFVVFAIVFGFQQVLQGSRARELQALQGVFAGMLDPTHKASSQRVLGLQRHHSNWDAEDIQAAEQEVELFQQLGFVVRHRLLRRRLILQMYSVLIINSWRALELFVVDERTRLGAPGFARDFEKLARWSVRYRRLRGLPIDGQVHREPRTGIAPRG